MEVMDATACRRNLKGIINGLTKAGFSNPQSKGLKVLERVSHLQTKYKGKMIALTFKTGRVEFLDHETLICVDYMEEEINKVRINATIDVSNCVKEKEIKRFHEAVKFAKKKKEEIFYISVENEYSITCWVMLFKQIEEWGEQMGDLELEKCNIRSWRWGEQKYYRLTFTSAKMRELSKIEFAFGHLINGMTYVVKKEDFKKHKKELYHRMEKSPPKVPESPEFP